MIGWTDERMTYERGGGAWRAAGILRAPLTRPISFFAPHYYALRNCCLPPAAVHISARICLQLRLSVYHRLTRAAAAVTAYLLLRARTCLLPLLQRLASLPALHAAAMPLAAASYRKNIGVSVAAAAWRHRRKTGRRNRWRRREQQTASSGSMLANKHGAGAIARGAGAASASAAAYQRRRSRASVISRMAA